MEGADCLRNLCMGSGLKFSVMLDALNLELGKQEANAIVVLVGGRARDQVQYIVTSCCLMYNIVSVTSWKFKASC